jgi:hypothetical protein
MLVRARLGAALCALAFAISLLVPRAALAWVEAHVEGDDVRVTLERTGDARVEHKITLKVAGGPLRSLDLRGVDPDASPEPDGYVVTQKEAARGSLGSATGVTAERLPLETKPRADGSPAPTVLRVRFDHDKGLGRGIYVLVVRYTTHGGARVTPDGSLSRIEWRGVSWEDGFDTARLTFDLPAAPTEPRADDAPAEEGAARAPLVLSNVRRGAMRDQIELVRPYAPKGEAITWAIRADARALKPPPAAPAKPAGMRAALAVALNDSAPRALLLAGAFALFVITSALVALKSAEVARGFRARGVEPLPLLPLPTSVRAILAGAALVGGLFVQLILARATIGALLVALAIALAAHQPPRPKRATLRGPGRWLPVGESTAFRDPPRLRGAWLDVSTREGKLVFLTLLGGVVALVAWLWETTPHRAQLIAFDAAALLAIFGTGRLAELPPDPATAPARILRDVAKRVRKAFPDARLVGRIRVPDGSSEADELRLAIAPKSAPAGFGAIEVGVVYAQGTGGALALPEVILRVTTGSPCEEAIDRVARAGRSTRGKKPNERAIVFSPRLPTTRMTAGIAIGLLRALAAARSAPSENVQPRTTRKAA